MKKCACFSLFVLFFFLCGLAGAAPEDRALAGLKAEAEKIFPQRYEPEKARQLIQAYEKILAQVPNSEEYWVKLSYACFWLGDRLAVEKTPKKELLDTYDKSIRAAREAIRVNPDSVGGNFWMTVSSGRLTLVKGILGGSFSLGTSIQGMMIVSRDDINFYFGGVYRYWGRFVFEIPKIARRIIDFKLEESAYFMKKSLEVAPNFFMNHVYLAETYLAMGRKDLAREELAWVLKTQPGILPLAEPENRLEQDRARLIWKEEFKEPPPSP
jgi:tetratricopeptide (TPR) repeat protein